MHGITNYLLSLILLLLVVIFIIKKVLSFSLMIFLGAYIVVFIVLIGALIISYKRINQLINKNGKIIINIDKDKVLDGIKTNGFDAKIVDNSDKYK